MPSRPVPSTSRRARRVIDSTSPSLSPSPSLNDDEPSPPVLRRGTKRSLAIRDDNDDDDEEVEGEEEEEEEEDEDAEGGDDEEDAEGEDDLESEGERGTTAGPSRVSSVIASEDMDIDEEDDTPIGSTSNSTTTIIAPTSAPKSALKIKLNVPPSAGSATVSGAGPSGGRTSLARGAVSNGGKKAKKIKYEDELESEDEIILQDDGPDEIDELDVDADEAEEDDMLSRQSYSPTKMTARQRAKGNKDLQETLLQLPDDITGKKAVVLTEAEKQQKREEISRRRKRQNDQKLQDEQDQTINRLLRAQTTKSRSKLDSDTIPGDANNTSSNASPSRRLLPSRNDNAIRWISSIKEGSEDIMIRVAVPKDKESWLDLPSSNSNKESDSEGKGQGKCAVDGCEERRKYRSVKKFEIGGCSLIHLKQVEASL